MVGGWWLVVGGWWRLRNPYEKLDEPSTNHTNPLKIGESRWVVVCFSWMF